MERIARDLHNLSQIQENITHTVRHGARVDLLLILAAIKMSSML
jgi:hypothetical protein